MHTKAEVDKRRGQDMDYVANDTRTLRAAAVAVAPAAVAAAVATVAAAVADQSRHPVDKQSINSSNRGARNESRDHVHLKPHQTTVAPKRTTSPTHPTSRDTAKHVVKPCITAYIHPLNTENNDSRAPSENQKPKHKQKTTK